MSNLFSIITVVLNDAEGLRKTASSIEQQAFSEFEWVVVDGGSSDGTLKQARNIYGKAPIVHSAPDNGIYDAMNKGIQLSSGEYLVFMNAGDTFAGPDALGCLAQYVESQPSVDVVLGGTCQKINRCTFYRKPRDIRWIVHGLPSFHQSTLYRGSLIRSHPYNLDFPLLADYAWLATACVEGIDVAYFNRPVSVFSVGGASYTNLRQKFKDSYRVKRDILKLSKIAALSSSMHAILKTLIVMFAVFNACRFMNRQPVEAGNGSNDTEVEQYKFR